MYVEEGRERYVVIRVPSRRRKGGREVFKQQSCGRRETETMTLRRDPKVCAGRLGNEGIMRREW